MLKLSRAWIVGIVWLLGWAMPANAGIIGDLVTLLRGLSEEGKVIRDDKGIPHIIANNEHDVLFLQGYTHAQDRLFQMDAMRRTAEGTLSELVGPAALASDVQLRTFGLRRAAERSLPVYSPVMRDALSAYADGVNAYVVDHPLPPEYAALEITTFRPWTSIDSLSISKLLGFGLSFELSDLDRTTLLSAYATTGATKGFNGSALFFEDVNRLAPFNNAATVPDASGPPAGGGGSSVSASLTVSGSVLGDAVTIDMAARFMAQLRALPFVKPAIKNPEDDRGSNEFAISGQRSTTGLPIVANDPHLQTVAPAIFYENEIRTPGFSSIGASFAGIPFVIVGNNDRIAWGLTTHLMDVTDVYQERIVPDPNSASGLSTMYLGNLEPVVALPQTFKANTLGDGIQNNVATVPAGGAIPPAVLIVPRRNQGPIIALNQAAGTAISVQYAGFAGVRDLEAFRGINRANNLNDFKNALQAFDVGSQNAVYADTAGNLAYFAIGEMPLREDLQAGAPNGLPPFLIRNGQGGNEWIAAQSNDPNRALPYEILPFSEMPQLMNPARGVIVNANNDPTGNSRDNNVLNVLRPGGGIRYLGSGYNFDLGIRAGRIEALFAPYLASGQKISMADLQRFQADTVMGDAQFFVPFILQALNNARRAGAPPELASLATDPRIVEAVGRFTAWDLTSPSGIVEGYDASDQNGVRAQPTQLEINNSIATAIYSVWRNQIVSQTLGATLSRLGVPFTSPRDIQLTALKNLFDKFPTLAGRGVSGVDFFEIPGVVAAPADRRDIVLLRSLGSALTLMAGPTFADAFNGSTNQADYRWGRLHRVVFAHPLGGSFNTPPAGGTFPQPLPNLPGIPTDGALHTVDPANHQLARDNSNGFMFTNSSARRYVATIKSNGVDSVTSVPGGASGINGNQFNVNLLPGWLTNEAFPLVSNPAPNASIVIRVDIFRPGGLLGGILK